MTRHKKMQKGGGAMVPNFGAPYNAADIYPNGNYYPYNPNVEQWPDQSNAIFAQRGGKKKSRKQLNKIYKKQRGGGITDFVTTLLPLEVVNIGRSIPAGLGHMYDRFNGSLSSASSMVYPTQQPLVSPVNASSSMNPPDILSMYNNNNNQVSRI
jgi:hypothetical protein